MDMRATTLLFIFILGAVLVSASREWYFYPGEVYREYSAASFVCIEQNGTLIAVLSNETLLTTVAELERAVGACAEHISKEEEVENIHNALMRFAQQRKDSTCATMLALSLHPCTTPETCLATCRASPVCTNAAQASGHAFIDAMTLFARNYTTIERYHQTIVRALSERNYGEAQRNGEDLILLLEAYRENPLFLPFPKGYSFCEPPSPSALDTVRTLLMGLNRLAFVEQVEKNDSRLIRTLVRGALARNSYALHRSHCEKTHERMVIPTTGEDRFEEIATARRTLAEIVYAHQRACENGDFSYADQLAQWYESNRTMFDVLVVNISTSYESLRRAYENLSAMKDTLPEEKRYRFALITRDMETIRTYADIQSLHAGIEEMVNTPSTRSSSLPATSEGKDAFTFALLLIGGGVLCGGLVVLLLRKKRHPLDP